MHYFIHEEIIMLPIHRDIFLTKDIFEKHLLQQLSLSKVLAPLFIETKTGIQDDLNSIERPVSFSAKQMPKKRIEIVQSLAKWKRLALAQYQIEPGEGIVAVMHAIRPDEEDLSSGIHSIFVDQWDWEKRILPEDRTLHYLKTTVQQIYQAIKKTENELTEKLELTPFLPDEITFIHAEELLSLWPDLTACEREDKICQDKGSVFIIGIGGELADGQKHDGRAPDYDDWSTPTSAETKGLNGDILVWNPILQRAFEISSMGIRVDKQSLLHQLELEDAAHRKELLWHQALLSDKLPLSIGGGIGQSRLVMLLLQKRHIGEVQASVWPEETLSSCEQNGINLL